MAFVTILILTFYLLIESESLFAGFARLFPRAERPRVEAVAREDLDEGQRVAERPADPGGHDRRDARRSGLYLLGVPYFYVLALLAAIGEMIPVVGPILSAVPAIARRAHGVAAHGALRRALHARAAAVREPFPRAEGHGAAGRRQRRSRSSSPCSSAVRCWASSARSSPCRPPPSSRWWCRNCSTNGTAWPISGLGPHFD